MMATKRERLREAIGNVIWRTFMSDWTSRRQDRAYRRFVRDHDGH